MNPSPSSWRGDRPILMALAVAALVVAWLCMTELARNDPWYDNADMNVHNMVDALALNSDVVPARIDQPGLPSKYLLALDYRVRHYLGQLPVWNLKKFGDAPDPLREIPPLLRLGREHSRLLVILFILTAAGFVYSVTRNPETALLAAILLSASAGLLFHGLINRPDLLCAWFGTVLAPFCAWRATSAGAGTASPGWLFLAGAAAGLATLTKLPGLYYLFACYAWCWLAAGLGASGVASGKIRLTAIALPVAGSAALFWLLIRLADVPVALGPVALIRLRTAAALVGALPLLALVTSRRRFGSFLLQRGRELAVLGGGALAVIPLGYGALRAVLSEPQALAYLARLLEFTFHPDPQMKYLLAATPRVGREFLLFVRESPFLFISAGAVAVAAGLARPVAPQLRAFIALLLVNAVAMSWLLAHRYFLDQFSLYAQVPLVLVWVLGLFALGVWRKESPDGAGLSWTGPLVLTGAAVLLATVLFRLEPKQRSYRTETEPPLSDLTVTFLYNHDAHPGRYRQIMQQHYPTREQFSEALQQYLADPAHRH